VAVVATVVMVPDAGYLLEAFGRTRFAVVPVRSIVVRAPFDTITS
jgi:hypothetical protein